MPTSSDGQHVYTPQEDLMRHGYDPSLKLWVVSQANAAFPFAAYPRELILPLAATDEVPPLVPSFLSDPLQAIASAVAQHRDGRFPLYRWGQWDRTKPGYGGLLLRGSRPIRSDLAEGLLSPLLLLTSVGTDLKTFTPLSYELAETIYLNINSPALVAPNEARRIKIVDLGADAGERFYSPFAEIRYLGLGLDDVAKKFKSLMEQVNENVPVDAYTIDSICKLSWQSLIYIFFDLACGVADDVARGETVLLQSGSYLRLPYFSHPSHRPPRPRHC